MESLRQSVGRQSVLPPLPSQRWYKLEMNRARWLGVEPSETGCLVSNASTTSHQLCDLSTLKCPHLRDEDTNNNPYPTVVHAELLYGKCLEQGLMHLKNGVFAFFFFLQKICLWDH